MRHWTKHWMAAAAGALIAGATGYAVARSNGETLAVSGKPIDQTNADLSACIARSCAAPDDIAASIAHADNQMAAGQWKEASATLAASRERNRRHAKQHPVEVANLLRNIARISILRGLSGPSRMATLEMVDALTEGLGPQDPRVFGARLEVVDMTFTGVPSKTTERLYRRVLDDARAQGLPVIEGMAMLRIATMFVNAAELEENQFRRRAEQSCDELIASTKPEHAPFARAAKVLKSQLAAFYMDPAGPPAVIGTLRALPRTELSLLSYAPVEWTQSMAREAKRFQSQTIDLTFWVAPDGRVRNFIGLLQRSRHLDSAWISSIVMSIASRSYAPLPLDFSDPGVLRVERYTITGGGEQPVRLQMRDMSDYAPMPVEVAIRPYDPNK